MKRTAIVTVFAIGLALALTAAAPGAAQSNAGTNESTASANASFGAAVSAFMQASSQEAAGEVDQETFAAASWPLACMNDETSAPKEALALAFDSLAPAFDWAAPGTAAVRATARPMTNTVTITVRFIVGHQHIHPVKTRPPFLPFSTRNNRFCAPHSVHTAR